MADMGLGQAKPLIGVLLLVCVGVLLFARLGHTALWDDESTTALYGKAVWRTGDSWALIDHNVVAFRNGVELRGLRNRYMPPLGFYLAAPFVGLLGDTSFAARLPFAVCGFLTVALIVRWLWRDRADGLTWLLIALGVVGNVSFMLFARQCRYYALSILLSTGLAYLYCHRGARRRTWLAVGFLSVALLASNPLNYAALYVVAAVDYVLWGRRSRPLTRADWPLLIAPQVILGAALLCVWNPLMARRVWPVEAEVWLADRLTIFWWNLRDLNGCEFGVVALMLAAPLVWIRVREPWLVRGPAAFLAYIVAITLLSPQQTLGTVVATVRYLVPLIPLCIAIGVLTIRALTGRRAWLAVPLALVAFMTNLMHGGPYARFAGRTIFSDAVGENRLRCTLFDYVSELRSPHPSSYAVVADWIEQNVRDEQPVYVVPNFATYPLMFHAPHALYAWQLVWPAEPQFARLDPIHFFGRKSPDYMIVFGPVVMRLKGDLERQGYDRIAVIDCFWADLIRPELFYHAFRPVVEFDRSNLGVHVFRRRVAATRPLAVAPNRSSAL